MPIFPSFSTLAGVLINENTCKQWLIQNGIVDSISTCSSCGDDVRIEDSLWRCRSRRCRKTSSIYKGSFFSLSKLSCAKVLQIGYFWLGGGNHSQIVNYTGCSKPTVTAYMGYYRQLVASSLDSEDTTIGGDGIIIELDESKFGKRKFHRGHRVEGVWVFGGVKRTPERRAFAEVVADRSASTLREVILRHVRPGSIVYTDLWRGYSDLESIGLLHDTVNHSLHFVSPTGVHTNAIEGTWNGIKLGVPPRNRNQQDMTPCLLDFIWRRKHSRDLWNGLIEVFKNVSYD